VFFSLFFQPEQYFSLTTNQPTVFFSRLISTAEWLLGLAWVSGPDGRFERKKKHTNDHH
jgi:hypothetical protein